MIGILHVRVRQLPLGHYLSPDPVQYPYPAFEYATNHPTYHLS